MGQDFFEIDMLYCWQVIMKMNWHLTYFDPWTWILGLYMYSLTMSTPFLFEIRTLWEFTFFLHEPDFSSLKSWMWNAALKVIKKVSCFKLFSFQLETLYNQWLPTVLFMTREILGKHKYFFSCKYPSFLSLTSTSFADD